MDNSLRLESIFFAALEKRSPAERSDYLDKACANNKELRASVEQMFEAQAVVGSFLEQPAIIGDATGDGEPTIRERPGTVIGPYKLLQQIGEGGMGIVFMAEQTQPIQRSVALKIIKPGMDTRQVIARFEAERQALAMMDHPNIAKVLDAGTTESGRPFFVMELVKGVPITEYCDDKRLSLRTRLELILPVCQAVQHAHQKGLIHRDIKPTNVLVAEYDNRAVPKVIDFGVAKATAQKLTDRTMFTEFGQVIGTVEYMSPEQAKFNQLDIDTRSDIYSLGVLLYELVTGSTPFERQRLRDSAFDEVLRIIREEEPPKPSTRLSRSDTPPSIAENRDTESTRLQKDVDGELDWIVMKALEKDRDRRYDTANNLAADVERYLRNEPVEAGPASAHYRVRKFVRRHKFGVAAGAAVVAALLIGAAGTTGGMIWALRERNAAQASAARATIQAQRSDQVVHFLEDMLQGVAPSVAMGRDTTMLREIVDQTADRVESELQDQPEVQIELLLALGKVYSDLHLYKKQEENALHVLQLARAHFGEENLAVADALVQLGRARVFRRTVIKGETVARQAIDMQRKLRGEGSAEEADARCNLSDILRQQSDTGVDGRKMLAEAESNVRAALSIRRKRFGNESDETAWALHSLALVLGTHAEANRGNLDDAEAAMREAYNIRQKIHGATHPFNEWDCTALANILLAQKKFAEAGDCYRKSIEILEQTDSGSKSRQANAHFNLGKCFIKQDETEEAEIQFRAAVSLCKKDSQPAIPFLTTYLINLARVLAGQNKLPEALQYAQEALDICQAHPDEVFPAQQRAAEKAVRDITAKISGTSLDVKK